MELPIFKFETEIKFISVLAFWGIRWLYIYLTASNDAISNMESKEPEQLKERGAAIQNNPNDLPPMATTPIAETIIPTKPPALSLPQLAATNRQSLQTAIENRKASLRSKRKLFRNSLLVDALMQRKGFIA